MTTPKFNSQISLGNIIQLLAVVVSVTIAYVVTREKVEANTANIQDIEGRVRVVERDTHTLPVELKNLADDMSQIQVQQAENNRLLRELLRATGEARR